MDSANDSYRDFFFLKSLKFLLTSVQHSLKIYIILYSVPGPLNTNYMYFS